MAVLSAEPLASAAASLFRMPLTGCRGTDFTMSRVLDLSDCFLTVLTRSFVSCFVP